MTRPDKPRIGHRQNIRGGTGSKSMDCLVTNEVELETQTKSQEDCRGRRQEPCGDLCVRRVEAQFCRYFILSRQR